ncbi:MAG: hypothetical protein ACRDY2_12070 [Acidimicrobiales bacterium]
MIKFKTKLAIASVSALPLIAGGVAFASVSGPAAAPNARVTSAHVAPANVDSGANVQSGSQSGANVQSGSQGHDTGPATEGTGTTKEAASGADTGANVQSGSQSGANVQSGSQSGPETPDAAGANG